MLRQAMIKPDRLELLIAALVSALLGIVTGYVAGKPSFGTLIWALIGAVVVSGMVYCLRAFR
jgi:F0F1-type ATP synthase assembly protein I